MGELHVTATDMRVHLKDYANAVARGEVSVVMSRHGIEVGVLISMDDFREWTGIKEKLPPPVLLEHPACMKIEDVERIYRETEGATDEELVRWRYFASLCLRPRRRSTGPPS